MNPPITDNLVLGRQLRCPDGLLATEIGDYIFGSNRNMIETTIDYLSLQGGESLLEIGFGNGKHLSYLFSKAKGIYYTGIEHSLPMIQQARINNQKLEEEGSVVFLQGIGEELPTFATSFSVCFSVNTYYFITDFEKYFKQIYNLLIDKGKLVLGYIDKEFGEKMPFTKEVFTFYSNSQLKELFLSIGFSSFEIFSFTEEIFSKNGKVITRPFYVAVINK